MGFFQNPLQATANFLAAPATAVSPATDPTIAISRETTKLTQPIEKTVNQELAQLDKDIGLSKLFSGPEVDKTNAEQKALDIETQRYIDEQKATAEQERIAFENEQRTYAAQAEAQRLADQEAFTKAQVEIEAIAQKERDVITRQAAEYDAQQKRLQEEAAAEALRLKAEQAALEQQRVEAEQQAALVKEKARTEFEGVQREGAEREAGRKRAARSATARPLLMGAAPNGGPQALGYGGSMGGGGTLGSTQTLGVG
jgi:flotillin